MRYTIKSSEGDRICELDVDRDGNLQNLDECPTYFRNYLVSVIHGSRIRHYKREGQQPLFEEFEPTIADLMREYLSQHGFTVIQRNDAVENEILEILDANADIDNREASQIIEKLQEMDSIEQEYILNELKNSDDLTAI